jgi:tetratricopeptide (TPR) repeat protein
MIRYLLLLLTFFVPLLVHTTTRCEMAREIIVAHQKDPAGKAKIAWMKKAMKLCPEVHHTQMLYGMAVEEFQDTKKQPNYARATEAFLEALAIEKRLPEASFRIAGIKFLEGEFRVAAYYYRKYLKDLPEDFNDARHLEEVEQYIIKSDWLNLLPGNIRLGTLRQDGAKARATFRFIGEAGGSIANSLYWSEGYSTGTGVGMLAAGLITLFAQEPKVRHDLIDKALRKQHWFKVHQLCRTNLSRVINLRGIEHQETYAMLHRAIRQRRAYRTAA